MLLVRNRLFLSLSVRLRALALARKLVAPNELSNLRGKAFIQISMLEEVLLGPWLF